MMDQAHLDGNVLGAFFIEVFGRDMTAKRGCCSHCGSITHFGAALVYLDAPGIVVRCPSCGNVLMVAVDLGTGYRISVEGVRWMEAG